MSPEAELIRTAQCRADYDAFAPIIKKQVGLPEAAAILEDIGGWYAAHPAEPTLDWSKFLAWAKVVKRATWEPDKWKVYETITKYAASLPAANPAIVERFKELTALAKIRERIEALIRSHTPGGLREIAEIADLADKATGGSSGSELVTDDFATLLNVVTRTDGLRWRLEDLNRGVGPIGRGDFIIIGKRPEVGGTTFIASEFTYMAPQLPEGKHAIIFNNEELGEKVKVRVIQSALGVTIADIATDPAKAKVEYERLMAGHRIDVMHRSGMTTGDVERKLRTGAYGLVAINVLDKIKGFSKLEGVERVRELGTWARGLADKYGVVFAVNQADASAEGERWLDQSQLYGSKTGLQGESDVQLMIGKDSNPANSEKRYLSTPRNKLPGGPLTIASMRHGRHEVGMDTEIGRFYSLVYK